MCVWILNLYQQLLNSLNEHHEVNDDMSAMQTVTIFEQIELTHKQLDESKIIKKVENLRIRTPNRYLAYRLELLLRKWNLCLQKESRLRSNRPHKPSNSVFEAIMQNDEGYFETSNIYELMHRLHKSFGQNGKVNDMATALNTISLLNEINIPDNELPKITAQFGQYLKRLRRLSSNRYLLECLTNLLVKWKELERSDANRAFPSSPEI